MTVTFEPAGKDTKLTLVQSVFVEVVHRDSHGEGWKTTFNSLEEYLAKAEGVPEEVMAALQIIGIPQSTYTRVVRMVAHEKGAAYEFVVARPHTPEVQAIHPAGKIPVMRHGDRTLFESRQSPTTSMTISPVPLLRRAPARPCRG